jgi:hypothetical protein
MADKKRRTATATRPAPAPRTVNDASIAERAYRRWLSRGCPVSDGQEDWFAAQAELLAETTRSTAPARAPKTQSLSAS